jgi:hypothetical protein
MPLMQTHPLEVENLFQVLEAQGYFDEDNRKRDRRELRCGATIKLFSDGSMRTLFTRDVDTRGLGFVLKDRLPLGHGGTVELPAPDGNVLRINCTVLRCRRVADGWYEGAIYFNREQFIFGTEAYPPLTRR